MRFAIVLFIFIGIQHQEVYSQKQVYGSECDTPIECVNSTAFAFCLITDGEKKLLGNQTCLKGQICSTSDLFHPCVDDVSTITSTISTTTQDPTTTVSPPNCEKLGSGNYPAPVCYQYYTCSKMIFWWDSKLKTCPKKKAFSTTLQKCVPSDETECANI